MDAGITTAALLFLTLFAVGYALWVMAYFTRGERREKPPGTPAPERKNRRDVIGKSRFVLPPQSKPAPTTATDPENGKTDEKADIFALASEPQHPRQIPPEKLDEVFGIPPAGVSNDPDPEDCPLLVASPGDYEADMEREIERDDEDDNESQPPAGRSLAKGVPFESIGEAYRTVAHDNPLTDEKRQEVGQTLLGLKQTDMFEAIVSARPDGNDKVSRLIDTYLEAFHRKTAAGNAGGPSPQVPLPDGFDVRKFV